MKPKLIVSGAAGRMGRRIISLAIDGGFFNITAAIEKANHRDLGKDAGVVAGKEPINVSIDTIYPQDAECMVDFSTPEAAGSCIDYCLKNHVALVLGTTGLSGTQLEKIRSAAQRIPIVHAANMSVGMNVLFALVGRIAATLGQDYDIEIVEAHHRFKKDAPSGTALTLAKNIASETGRDWPRCLVVGRAGKDALRQKNTIGLHAVRAGDIVGRHCVMYSTLGETIELTHTAHSRDTFAAGALHAAKWLIGKNPALYSMLEVLGLKQSAQNDKDAG